MSKSRKKERTETILIESDTFILKVVTSRERIRKPQIHKMKYQIPGSDGETMGGEYEGGIEESETSTHTITLTPTNGDGGAVFTCDGEDLNALIEALGKARGPQWLVS